jgi:hypothetical protein
MAFDPDKPVQTRDGHPARIVCTNVKGARPIIALVTLSDGSESAYTCYKDGQSQRFEMHPFDLVNVPEKRTVIVKRWLILYNDGTSLISSKPLPMGSRGVFAVRELNIHLDLTEGEGLTNG